MKIRRLQVIVKTIERCNLACSYCYYFFMGDQTFNDRPAKMTLETARGLASFIADGCRELGIPRVQIIAHGGEPMLQRPAEFTEMCAAFREEIAPVAELEFSMQTNGTILTSSWIKALQENAVKIGVSIDGPRDVHDRHRVDHRGRGSYDKIERNVATLIELAGRGEAAAPGVISVIDPANNYTGVVEHLATVMKLKHANFLLPDCSYVTGLPGSYTALDYGRALREIFDGWVAHPEIRIRIVSEILRRFQAAEAPQEIQTEQNRIIVAQSDGTIAIDDTLVAAEEWRKNIPRPHYSQTTLKAFFDEPGFQELRRVEDTTPTTCRSCTWVQLCGGGHPDKRFSIERGFDNPSVFCDGLKSYYEHVVRFLHRNGYPRDQLLERLGLIENNSEDGAPAQEAGRCETSVQVMSV